MTAKSRRELKQLFRTGAQPTAQDYSDVLDSGLNTLDDGISKPIEPHLPIRIKGISSGLPILDLYDDDTHNWRISLMSDTDSGYNIADPSGSSHFFLEDGTGDIGLGVTQPKAKLHINQSGSVGDALYIQDVANDQSPTRVSNAGHVYINTLKDGADSISLEDASLYVNGSFHVVDESPDAKSLFHVNESGAVTINGDLDISDSLQLGSSQTVTSISNTLVDGNSSSSSSLLTENAIHQILPMGSIIMWSGTTVPSGWALCDGQNGTPDLRGRFIIGAGPGNGLTGRTVNENGGSESSTLEVSNLPSHDHTATDSGHTHDITDPGHNHNITDPGHDHDVTDPGHRHTYQKHEDSMGDNADDRPLVSDGGKEHTTYDKTGISIDDGTTGISINDQMTDISINNSNADITIGNTGSNSPFSIIPPFYALYYIMKTTG